MSFNVIRTSRVDLAYLTELLNSRLVWYWLLKQGKLQGKQLQVDTEPLLRLRSMLPKVKIAVIK